MGLLRYQPPKPSVCMHAAHSQRVDIERQHVGGVIIHDIILHGDGARGVQREGLRRVVRNGARGMEYEGLKRVLWNGARVSGRTWSTKERAF